jgi:hypothetical protein
MQMQANRGNCTLVAWAVAGRCFVVCLIEAAAGGGLYELTRPRLRSVACLVFDGTSSQDPMGLDQIVVDAAACLVCLSYTVLVVTSLMIVGESLSQHAACAPSFRWVGAPSWWRRVVLVACGLSLLAPVTAGPSFGRADEQPRCPRGCADVRSARSVLAGLPLPDLPSQQTPRAGHVVVVRPGDCLWLIARRLLGPTASDTVVYRSVQRLYASNSAAIGPDPDLILPGTELTTFGGTR